ncbi:hypothetical protein [Exiguobacterium sp. s133]|uniref:phage lytic cycle repressor MrpR family protein n=1 Tax=Exiguobacterium sp. s133 TaxID=2751213 RepID=UPI001BEA0B94|nr:hypothetical protein [Exiguobacterium sp. s133]
MVQSKENYVADPEWYDFEVKEKYLDNISESQKTYAMFLMKKMSEHEKVVDEPLYDQTTSNIESFLFSLAPLTNKTSYKGIGYVVRYMRFAAELGVKKSNIILIENSPEYADKFVPQNARTFITLNQLDAIINNCVNHQDKVIFRLLFEGLRGDKLSELRNLKPNEVYEKQLDGRTQFFIDINSSEKNNRTIRITENLYYLCKNAADQETYLLNNGREVNENVAHRRGDEQDLIDSGYVLKRSKIGRNASDEEASISYHGLYLRVKRIMDYEEFQGIDGDYMKFGNLYQSGALYEAYRIIDLEYAEGLLGACTKEEREEIYNKVNWLSIRRKVCEKFIYVHDQKSKELISIDNMIKYY